GSRNIDMICDKCEARFTLFVDFRRYFRKKTSLQGIVYNLDEKFCKITIENLSRSGVRFTMGNDFTVEIDEPIDVQFTLDDEDRTFIRKRATVRFIKDNYIGAEFTELQKFGKELGLYLKRLD
ncbi:MAG: PilZ domain-containing protein, partial [Thermodesulfobacteriota bacterium]|nr:PilZ domain-containing protein [Thermodesulfobacteriota bacterium]